MSFFYLFLCRFGRSNVNVNANVLKVCAGPSRSSTFCPLRPSPSKAMSIMNSFVNDEFGGSQAFHGRDIRALQLFVGPPLRWTSTAGNVKLRLGSPITALVLYVGPPPLLRWTSLPWTYAHGSIYVFQRSAHCDLRLQGDEAFHPDTGVLSKAMNSFVNDSQVCSREPHFFSNIKEKQQSLFRRRKSTSTPSSLRCFKLYEINALHRRRLLHRRRAPMSSNCEVVHLCVPVSRSTSASVVRAATLVLFRD